MLDALALSSVQSYILVKLSRDIFSIVSLIQQYVKYTIVHYTLPDAIVCMYLYVCICVCHELLLYSLQASEFVITISELDKLNRTAPKEVAHVFIHRT